MPRLAYITGLRGIAALFVVFWHIVTTPTGGPPHTNFIDAPLLYKVLWFAMFGPQMVWLFLMISGFALYWSEMNRRDRSGRATSTKTYFERRVWRIAPIYYFAIALSLTILILGRPFYLPPAETDTGSLPVTVPGFVSHLFFLQNLNKLWQPQINPSLWSLAFEVQVYLLFPLLVLKWRRASLAIAVVFVGINHMVMAWFVRPEFVVMDFFIAGVLLAAWLREPRREWPPSVLSGIAFVFIFVPAMLFEVPIDLLTSEPFWLIGFTALIVRLHRDQPDKINLTTWQPTQRLGDISYSVYAVHFTLILAVWWFVGRSDVALGWQSFSMFALSLPLIFVVARTSYRFIEKPSLAKSQAARDPQAAAASQPDMAR
jgi:peptidoglycan/LPS O-acetylase OafA/YrhL